MLYVSVSLHKVMIYIFKIKEVLSLRHLYSVRAFSGILFSASSVCKSVLEGRTEHLTLVTYLAVKKLLSLMLSGEEE